MTDEAQLQQVRTNTEAFIKEVSRLLDNGLEGQYALMRDGVIEACLQDFNDAMVMGRKLFKGKPFSVQPITKHPVHLGSRSYL